MAQRVEINEGFVQVALPDGHTYDGGDQAVLTDEQFAEVRAAMFDEILTDVGYESDHTIVSPDGTEYRITVDNAGTLSTEEV